MGLFDELESEIRVLERGLERKKDQCIYNANSIYLQCAVNPKGDCKTCPHFEPKS